MKSQLSPHTLASIISLPQTHPETCKSWGQCPTQLFCPYIWMTVWFGKTCYLFKAMSLEAVVFTSPYFRS